MTINTRYLVLGDRPTEKTAQDALAAYSNIDRDASEKGVEKISVNKLLDMMGYQGGASSVQLGRGAKASDFKAKPKGGVVRSSTGTTAHGNSFESRRPPAGSSTTRRSAYD